MKNLILLSLLIVISFQIKAQTFTLSPSKEIATLVDDYKKHNFSKSTWSGWRIQLVATTERSKMENMLGRWRSLYPYFEAKWFHSAPYYILRVGAFTNRLEAIQFLQKIKHDFNGAYPAKDKSIPTAEFFLNY